MTRDNIIRMATRRDRVPYVARMSRPLALRLGAYQPSHELAMQLSHGRTNVPIMVVAPVVWIKKTPKPKETWEAKPDGQPGLVWNVRDDNEGDIKRRPKEKA